MMDRTYIVHVPETGELYTPSIEYVFRCQVARGKTEEDLFNSTMDNPIILGSGEEFYKLRKGEKL